MGLHITPVKHLLEELTADYSRALQRYFDGSGEEALLAAYDAGRRAVSSGIGVLELSAIHQVALTSVLLARLPRDEQERLARLAADFSAESLVPFEITARGAREDNEVLRRLNEVLEEKNGEIQRQLQELIQLQSLKDDLISLIVHDLRNPLAGVVSCLKLIEPKPGGPDPGGVREMVGLAREGLRKLSELVSDLLEVRQLEEGKLELKRQSCSVGEVLRQAMATLEATAKLSAVKLELGAVPEATVTADVRLLRRSIENLISNALKFSRDGDAVSIGAELAPGGIAIEVADRGPGLPDELKDRLFSKFASVDKSAARRGYGLGLYVVKLVATAHGGSVAARTRDGGGTVFRITLPIG